jgi:hypothetical protein
MLKGRITIIGKLGIVPLSNILPRLAISTSSSTSSSSKDSEHPHIIIIESVSVLAEFVAVAVSL